MERKQKGKERKGEEGEGNGIYGRFREVNGWRNGKG